MNIYTYIICSICNIYTYIFICCFCIWKDTWYFVFPIILPFSSSLEFFLTYSPFCFLMIKCFWFVLVCLFLLYWVCCFVFSFRFLVHVSSFPHHTEAAANLLQPKLQLVWFFYPLPKKKKNEWDDCLSHSAASQCLTPRNSDEFLHRNPEPSNSLGTLLGRVGAENEHSSDPDL